MSWPYPGLLRFVVGEQNLPTSQSGSPDTGLHTAEASATLSAADARDEITAAPGDATMAYDEFPPR
jgi:hypothetical protein